MILSLLVILSFSLELYANASRLPYNLGPVGFEGNGSATDQKICSGDMGSIQNVLIEVTYTDMQVTYDPPYGYESCNIDYETKYELSNNFALLQKTTNKYLKQSYNYWEGTVLCKLVNLYITPIYNGIQGETYQSNQFTDKFDPYIDVGSPRKLSVTITDLLHAKWISPIDYDTCPIYFSVEIMDITGQILNSGSIQGYEWYYDYGADGNYCKNVIVRVQSMFRGKAGGMVTASAQLGSQSSGSC